MVSDESNIDKTPRPFVAGKIRSSKAFIQTVVYLAIFSAYIPVAQNVLLAGFDLSFAADAYLYSLIIPVLPFALVERVQLHEDDVQRWIGILLAAYGAGLLVGSRKL